MYLIIYIIIDSFKRYTHAPACRPTKRRALKKEYEELLAEKAERPDDPVLDETLKTLEKE